jgi:hypothetical protein
MASLSEEMVIVRKGSGWRRIILELEFGKEPIRDFLGNAAFGMMTRSFGYQPLKKLLSLRDCGLRRRDRRLSRTIAG